jgi:predicted nucleotide-binding protein (sugar kinase/HSP70/actin superfamily)
MDELRSKHRSHLRIGIPKTLNIWSTHRFWIGFLTALGVPFRNIVFSSDTSENQGRRFGKARGTVDCCYPVKCMSGHYGELLFGRKEKVDLLLSPMIYTLPSFLRGHVVDTLACPRVMAAPESIKAGFLKGSSVFEQNQVLYLSPFVSLGEPELTPDQLHRVLGPVLQVTRRQTRAAVRAGFQALEQFNARMRAESLEILRRCAAENRPCVLVLARPYHLDPGIGHEIEAEIQASGYPILWSQYLPIDAELINWLFSEDLRVGRIRHPLEIEDVWTSSYSSNTNEILWAAKFAARCPWITSALHLSSYECGMDQPTCTPVQRIVEASGTLFFRFADLDATKPGGSVQIRIQTILHYLRDRSPEVIRRKHAALPGQCPLFPEKRT